MIRPAASVLLLARFNNSAFATTIKGDPGIDSAVTKKFRSDPFDMNEDERRALVNFDIIVINKDGDFIIKANPGAKPRAIELLLRYKKCRPR